MIIFDKISTGQPDDYASGCLLESNYFKKYFKMIVIDLCRQETLCSDPKVIKQINLTGYLENQSKIFFISEEAKETVFNFSKQAVKILFYFLL